MSNKLFSSYQLGELTLKNRVVMAPMTRSRALINNIPSDIVADYYGQRASAGLIITEGTSPSPNGLGYPRIPGIYSGEQIESWKRVTGAVHEEGGKIFLQLMHVGRVAHEDNLPEGAEIVAPSSKMLSGEMFTDSNGSQPHGTPRKMNLTDIKHAIEEYVQAAKNAITAGFDGVEIHGANGYLVEQFINPLVNDRDDEYGSSIENRSRFLVEIAKEMVAAIGKGKVGLRLSPYGLFNDMGPFDQVDETFEYIAKKMREIGIVYIHIVDHADMGGVEPVPEKVKQIIRKTFGGTFILSGGYDRVKAESDLQNGSGDLVAFGRPFISNPDLVERMRANATLANPDFSTFYTPGKEGYIDYPKLEASEV